MLKLTNILTVKLKQGSVKTFESMVKRVRKIPDLTSEAMNQWGHILAKDLQVSAKIHGKIKPWRGTLMSDKGIQWRQKPKGRVGRLYMVRYGVMLDRMTPHFVSLKPGRLITQWAKDPNKMNITPRTVKPFQAIRVKPHPFISAGYRIARPKLKTIIKQNLRRNKT